MFHLRCALKLLLSEWLTRHLSGFLDICSVHDAAKWLEILQSATSLAIMLDPKRTQQLRTLTHLRAELLSLQDDTMEEANHEHHRPAAARLNYYRGRSSAAATILSWYFSA
jgi:hypothetical protein